PTKWTAPSASPTAWSSSTAASSSPAERHPKCAIQQTHWSASSSTASRKARSQTGDAPVDMKSIYLEAESNRRFAIADLRFAIGKQRRFLAFQSQKANRKLQMI